MNPQRETETLWVHGTPFNRVDVERGVFQRENMEYLTGEFEAFLYGGKDGEETVMRVSLECANPDAGDRRAIEDRFITSFFSGKTHLKDAYNEGLFRILFHYTRPGDLELYRVPGRSKRLVDRRS